MDELIDQNEFYNLKRNGRFLVAELMRPHQVLSTSVCGGGMRNDICYLVKVSAAAYAFAAVWDRVRCGTISHLLAAPVLRQQAATLATSDGDWFPDYDRLADAVEPAIDGDLLSQIVNLDTVQV